MRKSLYVIGLIAVLFTSCQNNDLNDYPENRPLSKDFSVKDREFPLKDFTSSHDIHTKSSNRYISKGTNLLGYGYNLNATPVQDHSNFTYPILDINKIFKSNPSIISKPMFINNTTVNINTFTSFDEYEEIVSKKTTKTMSSGFKLNLGIFSIGSKAKQTMTSIFGQGIVHRQNSVYGEVNVVRTDSIFKINTGVIGESLAGFLDDQFLQDLYNAPFPDVIDHYGPFMTTEIHTGGNLSLLYSGYTLVDKTAIVRQDIMNRSIEASFTVENIFEADSLFKFKFDKDKYEYSMKRDSLSGFRLSYKTSGGIIFAPSFSTSNSVRGLENVDLGSWFSSLNDHKNLVVSNVGNNSLYPILNLFIEENFKEKYKRYMSYDRSHSSNVSVKTSEPYIYIETYGSRDMNMANFFLVNKFGEYITLHYTQLPGLPIESETYKTLYKEYFENDLTDIFNGLKISARHYYVDKGEIPQNKEYVFLAHLPQHTISDMELVTSTIDGRKYLLSKKNKIGFSIYSDNTLELYGFSKESLNKLSKRNISFEALLLYKIYAL